MYGFKEIDGSLIILRKLSWSKSKLQPQNSGAENDPHKEVV